MPYLLLQTNRPLAPAQRTHLLRQLSAAVAEMLEKPEEYVMVSLEDGKSMLFGGSDAPCAYLELKSIELPEEKSALLSASLCTLVGDLLALPTDRIYIEFANARADLWGWNGGTF